MSIKEQELRVLEADIYVIAPLLVRRSNGHCYFGSLHTL